MTFTRIFSRACRTPSHGSPAPPSRYQRLTGKCVAPPSTEGWTRCPCAAEDEHSGRRFATRGRRYHQRPSGPIGTGGHGCDLDDERRASRVAFVLWDVRDHALHHAPAIDGLDLREPRGLAFPEVGPVSVDIVFLDSPAEDSATSIEGAIAARHTPPSKRAPCDEHAARTALTRRGGSVGKRCAGRRARLLSCSSPASRSKRHSNVSTASSPWPASARRSIS